MRQTSAVSTVPVDDAVVVASGDSVLKSSGHTKPSAPPSTPSVLDAAF